jgi:hypothetical protein
MPSPSTSRQRTLRVPRTRTPLRVVPSGALPEPGHDPAPHRFVLIRLPWTRALLAADPNSAFAAPGAVEQRAA